MKLFDDDPDKVTEVVSLITCRTCEHRQRWQCGGRVIQYCGVRHSNRTDNKLLKIKVTTPACLKYQPENKNLTT